VKVVFQFTQNGFTGQLALEVVLALGIKPIAAPEWDFVANKANFLGDKISEVRRIS
jgi:hypothetical protein